MLYTNLEKNRKNLNNNEEEILSYLLKNKDEIQSITISGVANQFYTVPNTIVRMCKKLGFEGFRQFKDAVESSNNLESKMGIFTSLDNKIIKTTQLLKNSSVEQTIKLIHEASKILFFAVGLSRFPAEELSERLKIVGKPNLTFVDPHVMIYNAELMKPDDLAIAISLSGRENSNVYSATSRAKIAGANTVSLTGFSSNPLSNLTDLQLYGHSSDLLINNMDVADRISLHYITNLLFNEYIKKYHIINTKNGDI